MKRKIAAIVAADVAGYSKLVADDEEDALRRLQASREVFDEFVVRYGGRIFNTAGDAVLAEFASAVEAVRCALEIQESLRTKNLGVQEDRQMQFRLGINIGDVVERDGDLLGDGVNIAARLQGLANPGGICVSRTVYEQVANKVAVGFDDIGPQTVKNIPSPIHAYFVDAQAGRQPRRPAKAAQAPPAMLLAAAGVAALGLVAAVTVWVTREPPRVETAAKVVSQAPVAAPQPAAPTPSPTPAPPQVAASPPPPAPAEPTPSPPAPVAQSPAPPLPPASTEPAPSPTPTPAPVAQAPTPPPQVEAKATPPASLDGDYSVTFDCEKLEWTRGPLYQTGASATIRGGKISIERPIHYPTLQSPVVGVERGTGTVEKSGRIVVTTSWTSDRRQMQSRYEGTGTAAGGTLRGVQDWVSEGKPFKRPCVLTLTRK